MVPEVCARCRPVVAGALLSTSALISASAAMAWIPPSQTPAPESAHSGHPSDGEWVGLAGLEQIPHPAPEPVTVLVSPGAAAFSALDPTAQSSVEERLASLGPNVDGALLDQRGDRFATLWLHEPLVATDGVDREALAESAEERLRSYLEIHRDALRIDPAEIRFTVGVHEEGRLVQLHGDRYIGDVPVEGASLTATIVAGNLVLLGAERWGDVEVDANGAPALDAEQLRRRLVERLGADASTLLLLEGDRLELVPVAVDGPFDIGAGYQHLVARRKRVKKPGAIENYEAVINATSGALISFFDTNRYHDGHRHGDMDRAEKGGGGGHRNVHGGVFPISNDGKAPDGIEAAGWPMPFVEVTHAGGSTVSDAGGNVSGVVGEMSVSLSGPYVSIDETCGSIDESSTGGDLDLGTSGGTDCTVPAGGSAGNTHSARTAFYQVNRIVELGRTRLPSNAWLQSPLPVSLNQFVWCNAVWTGTGLSFFQEQAPCSNLGELAGVLDHEWGHGMDDNGTNGSVSNPGEGIADAFAALRLGDSCPGRGALANVCDGFGDPCIEAFGCTAARDIDWQRHESQQPHDVAWVNSNCNGSPHCRGMLTGESIWDLYKRDLPARYGYDDNTALEVATRLTFLGADNVGSWYVSNNGNEGGCGANSGYQQFLAADDDNGNLADGTPHMRAIHDAFSRHGIACDTPTVQDSGCVGAPSSAPTVAISSADRGADLSWTSVAGATRYKVYRTDGVRQCARGKALVGEVTGTTFTDSGLQNGREYYYVVAPFGASDACMGPASDCTTVEAGASPMLFADGFEGGNTAAWSSQSP